MAVRMAQKKPARVTEAQILQAQLGSTIGGDESLRRSGKLLDGCGGKRPDIDLSGRGLSR